MPQAANRTHSRSLSISPSDDENAPPLSLGTSKVALIKVSNFKLNLAIIVITLSRVIAFWRLPDGIKRTQPRQWGPLRERLEQDAILHQKWVRREVRGLIFYVFTNVSKTHLVYERPQHSALQHSISHSPQLLCHIRDSRQWPDRSRAAKGQVPWSHRLGLAGYPMKAEAGHTRVSTLTSFTRITRVSMSCLRFSSAPSWWRWVLHMPTGTTHWCRF